MARNPPPTTHMEQHKEVPLKLKQMYLSVVGSWLHSDSSWLHRDSVQPFFVCFIWAIVLGLELRCKVYFGWIVW